MQNAPNLPSSCRTKICVEINDDSHGTYNTNSQVKLKTFMLRPRLCDYSDAYIFVRGTISVTNIKGTGVATINKNSKRVVFKSCALFTDCINEINNTQIDDTKHIDAVMLIHNLIKCSDNLQKTSGGLR